MKKFAFLALIIFSLAFVPHSHRVRASFVNSAQMAEKLLELTNHERVGASLSTLTLNSELTQAAQAKAEDMLKESYFSHTSPGGKVFYHWVDSTGYEYSAVGENLALDLNTASAEQMVESWLNSPGHRANLLSSTYTETGIGVSSGIYQGEPAVFAVQVFATPKNKVANKIAVPVAVSTKVAGATIKAEEFVPTSPAPSPLKSVKTFNIVEPVAAAEIAPPASVPEKKPANLVQKFLLYVYGIVLEFRA